MSQSKLNVDSHEEAQQVIRSSATGFLVIAGLQAVLGFFVAPAVLLDAALYAILGLALLFLKSRVVAIFLVLLSLLTLVTTVANRLDLMDSGGNNVFLAILLVYLSIRALLAAFALHNPTLGAPPTSDDTPPPPKQTTAVSPLERYLLIAAALLIGLIAMLAIIFLRT